MIDTNSSFGQVSNGTGTLESAPYKRSHAYTKEKVYSGLMWVDPNLGIANPPARASKQPKSVPDFDWKNAALSGPSPFRCESAEVVRIKPAALAWPGAAHFWGFVRFVQVDDRTCLDW